MPTNPKTSVNPLHAAFPQIFKRNGEVRRLSGAPKFSRKLAMEVDKKVPSLMKADSFTIETPVGLFVLTTAMTRLIQSEDGMVHALMYNGWVVYPSLDEVYELIPATTQLAMEMDG